ncbi:hypothetical protein BDW74DRAFT_182488 [Aspergillus multicolor]|uniref:uncharacterized protein n=1 Tax=Aspergillus multicolor TaxID=41759 RepID=UPI003CCD54B2
MPQSFRVAPNERSFSSASSWFDIYGIRPGHRLFTKSPFYDSGSFAGRAHSIVSERDPIVHGRMRKNISHAFSHINCYVRKEFDTYFLKNWDFPDEKAETLFLNAGFSRVTCLYFPLAKDDRIHFPCRILTILFLIDHLLQQMSAEAAEAYNAKLIPIARGEVLPDPTELADAVLEPSFAFMRAQADRVRESITELNQYLAYREDDASDSTITVSGQSLSGRPESMGRAEKHCSCHRLGWSE